MHTMRTVCLMAACLVAATYANPNFDPRRHNAADTTSSRRPSEWLTTTQLESLPSMDQISMQQLENMSPEKGAELMNKMYHLSQMNHDMRPSFVPSASSIPAYILRPNGQNVSVTLNQLAAAAKQQPNFGEQEVTIFMTGCPQHSHSVRKATHKMVEAYMERYDAQYQAQMKQRYNRNNRNNNEDYDYDNNNHRTRTSSEEDYSQISTPDSPQTGDLIVINLGQTLTPFKRAVMLDTERTGAMIGDMLVDLATECNVPEESIHMIAQGVAANVAGAAGRRYRRQTGRSIRRITGLDPARVYARDANTVTGLARGDADFVDAIHTSSIGPNARAGDVDFYPNGPHTNAPGADNIVEASMRATRYFAESVRPGNERNFPAVKANSMQQYKNKNGHGKRAYMGIATEFDVEGDYMLEVNAKSPFGQRTPAERQRNFHATKQAWNGQRAEHNEDYYY